MPIVLSRDFDSGIYNVDGTQTATDTFVSSDGLIIHLRPVRNWLGNGSTWQWFAARADGVLGLAPRVHLNTANRQWSLPLPTSTNAMYVCVWSYTHDGDHSTWHQFDNVTVAGSIWQFWNNAPFTQDRIYIAHQPLFPWARWQSRINDWIASPHVQSPASAIRPFVLGDLTARSNYVGRLVPSLPIYAAVSKPTSASPRAEVVMTGGIHCDERHGAWCAEAAFDFMLLSGHADAQWMFDRVKFLFIFCLNPQGIHGGAVRSTLQNPTVDLNRRWGEGFNDQINQVVEAAIATETPNARALIDWHNLGNVGSTNTKGSKLQFSDSPQIRAFIDRITPYHPVSLFTG